MSPVNRMVRHGLIQENVPLGPLTTYKSGGPARYLIDVLDSAALVELAESGDIADLPVLVLGRGSNLVVSDTGFPGLVIRLGEGFARHGFDGDQVVAGAAMALPRLARAAVEQSLAGLEFFVGIPGSVGGAVRQNAGCFGYETRDRLVHATVVELSTGASSVRTREDLDLSYRHSNIGSTEVVVEAVFKAVPGNAEASKSELRRITRWRRDNQPGGTFNAGSVFKNPPHVAAGVLIDSLGLKGMSVGDVSVSEKHANFFVAGAGATSADILELVIAVKTRVFEESGTILEPEIQFVGFET